MMVYSIHVSVLLYEYIHKINISTYVYHQQHTCMHDHKYYIRRPIPIIILWVGVWGHYPFAPVNLVSPLSSSFALVNNLVSPLSSSFAPVNHMSPLIVKLVNMLQRQLRRCTCSPSGPPRCHLRN